MESAPVHVVDKIEDLRRLPLAVRVAYYNSPVMNIEQRFTRQQYQDSYGFSVVGGWVSDTAFVDERTIISSEVIVSHKAHVEACTLKGRVWVDGYVHLLRSSVYGCVAICGHGTVVDSTIAGVGTICGRIQIKEQQIIGSFNHSYAVLREPVYET